MRTSAILVLVGLAGVPAFGQNTFLGQNAFPKSPAPLPPRFEYKDMPQFKGSGDGRSWLYVVPNPFSKSKLPGVKPLWFDAGKNLDLQKNVCAIPLLSAPIPKEMRFSTPLLKGEEIGRMPEAQLPAPSCGDKGR
jgi:hypothetical protein